MKIKNITVQITVQEFVEQQPIQRMSSWMKLIEKEKLDHAEKLILDCAEYLGKIEINHEANFGESLLSIQKL